MTLGKTLRTLFCNVVIAASLLVSNAALAQFGPPPAHEPFRGLPDVEAVRRAQEGAQQGNTDEMNLLGMTYAAGDGSVLPIDQVKGIEWLRRSAELGNVEGQLALAMVYDHGKDHEQAVRWYRKAADAGIDLASFLLSLHLLDGHGVEREPGEAVRLAMKAAEEAEPVTAGVAMFLLGHAYLDGVRAPLDPAEGIRWFRKAAGHGDVYAMEELGLRYLQGKDVPRDESVGVQWLRFAAERGHVRAMRSLGAVLMEGRGNVQPDREEAAKWLRKAAESGDEGAAASCDCAGPAG